MLALDSCVGMPCAEATLVPDGDGVNDPLFGGEIVEVVSGVDPRSGRLGNDALGSVTGGVERRGAIHASCPEG